jgi:flagellar basal-body rod protein FlgB
MKRAEHGALAERRWIGRLLEACPVLDDVTTLSLQTAVYGLGTRQRVTANNIANIETPGFKASSVSFESSLASAVQLRDPLQTDVTTTETTDMASQNGNNVDLEKEVVTATKTNLAENLISNALTSTYGYINTVLKG